MTGRSIFVSLSAILFAGTTSAYSVISYKFDAYSSYPVSGFNSVAGSFTYISTHFFTGGSQWTSVGSLSKCSVPGATCGQMGFWANAWTQNKWDLLSFGIKNAPDGSSTAVNYYFDLGAFSTPGDYDSILLGPAQAGHLKVSQVFVPDPPSPCGQFSGECPGGAPYSVPNVPPPEPYYPYPGPAGEPNPYTSFAVPEPEIYSMLLAGLGMLGVYIRRKKQQQASP